MAFTRPDKPLVKMLSVSGIPAFTPNNSPHQCNSGAQHEICVEQRQWNDQRPSVRTAKSDLMRECRWDRWEDLGNPVLPAMMRALNCSHEMSPKRETQRVPPSRFELTSQEIQAWLRLQER